jgi:type IV pilus assembly protein PilP
MTRVTALALAAAAVAVVGGCSEKKPAPRPIVAPPAAAAADAKPEAKPAEPAAPEWTYSSIGKRDPFKSFLAEVETSAAGVISRCTTPLGRFELDQLRLVAVVTGLEDPVAMVEAPNGIGYAVRRGACIGRNGGTVAAVRTGELVVAEWVTRNDGSREKAQTVVRLPKQASLNIEE